MTRARGTRYAYVLNDPLARWDDGMSSDDWSDWGWLWGIGGFGDVGGLGGSRVSGSLPRARSFSSLKA